MIFINKNNNSLIEAIFNGEGFYTDKTLKEAEFNYLYETVQNSYSDTLSHYMPDGEKKYNIKDYEKLDLNNEHKKIWTKSNRILKEKAVKHWIDNSELISYLKAELGNIRISDEEDMGYPNVYWRLVRSNKKEDIGPLHRDEWFWILNDNYKDSESQTRIKVWIPLLTETGQNGLLVLPNSHKDESIKWNKFDRDGEPKPKLYSCINNKDLKLLNLNKKNLVIFNDRLLHGGALNKGTLPRVSLEFTIFINKL